MSIASFQLAADCLKEHVMKYTVESRDLLLKRELYKFELNRPGNIIFLVVFAGIAAFNITLLFRSKQVWYNVCFIIGFVLETLGYLGRVLAFKNSESMGLYILQSFCLTIAPAVIMAGIYFLFAQMVAVHGRQYSPLRPMWYSYFFISTDIFSVLVQGSGGGLASRSGSGNGNHNLGNIIMFIGILIQIVAMTIFLVFWFIFLFRTYFHDRANIPEHTGYQKRSFANYMKLLLNVPSARSHKLVQLEPFYNQQYSNIRSRVLYSYYALAISSAVILVYIRCIYRVVELKQGFDGYLMNHEIYLFVLDSALIAATGLVFVPFHPMFVFGRENVLSSKDIRKCSTKAKTEVFTFQDRENLEKQQDVSSHA